MHEIDYSQWKEFRIDEIFTLELSKEDNKEKLLQPGELRLISAGSSNNGVVTKVLHGAEQKDPWPAGSLTVDMFGQAFYQSEDFIAVSHGRVNILISDEPLSEAVGLFLAALLSANLLPAYSFGKMCSQARLSEEIVCLPATTVGEPDWDYMENFMNEVREDVQKRVEIAQSAESPHTEIDVSEWKEFPIGELFNVHNGACQVVCVWGLVYRYLSKRSG